MPDAEPAEERWRGLPWSSWAVPISLLHGHLEARYWGGEGTAAVSLPCDPMMG